MKKPLVIISACQFTRLALESLIPADRYIVRVYSNVTTEVEFVLKTSCGYLLADIPSLPSGELVLLACLVRLRSDAGQWQVCLTGDSDWFDIQDAVTAESNGIYGYMQDMSDNIPLIDSLSMCRTWCPEFFIQRKLSLVNQ